MSQPFMERVCELADKLTIELLQHEPEPEMLPVLDDLDRIRKATAQDRARLDGLLRSVSGLWQFEAILSTGQVEPITPAAVAVFRELRGLLVHAAGWKLAEVDINDQLSLDFQGVVEEKLKPIRPGRRTRCAANLASRLLSPADRQRYREEWAAELADLPRRDQAPHAFRLLIHGWSLRRSLNEKPSRAPTVGLAVMVVVPGADALAAVCGLDWQATVLGVGWTVGLMWIIASKERTQNLVTLIREARTSKAPSQK